LWTISRFRRKSLGGRPVFRVLALFLKIVVGKRAKKNRRFYQVQKVAKSGSPTEPNRDPYSPKYYNFMKDSLEICGRSSSMQPWRNPPFSWK
jgi:hypothetical protein